MGEVLVIVQTIVSKILPGEIVEAAADQPAWKKNVNHVPVPNPAAEFCLEIFFGCFARWFLALPDGL